VEGWMPNSTKNRFSKPNCMTTTFECPKREVMLFSSSAKNQNYTCTHDTHFGNTTGLPVPILNPSHFLDLLNYHIYHHICSIDFN
jgi:hypothetical protein